MLEIINYLHEKNIVLRNLNAESWRFHKGTDGERKLMLVNLSHVEEIKDDKTYKSNSGSPLYTSPENISDYNVTGTMLYAADMWAVGVITYMCVLGVPPWNGTNNKEMYSNILKHNHKYPEKLAESQNPQKKDVEGFY
eukprot:UN26281